MRCNAKSKQTGEQCKKHAMPGKTKCRYHGGASLSGMASPTWKHGRHSKYLPSSLLSKYQEAQRDPDLLNLRDEISLLDVRLKQLLEKLPAGGASRSWFELRNTWQELIDAQRAQDSIKISDAARKLNEIIAGGAEEAGIWNDIIISVDNRRKLTASEAKRLTDMQQTVTADKAMSFAYAVLDISRRNILALIPDKSLQVKVLTAMSEQIRAIVTIPARTIETDE